MVLGFNSQTMFFRGSPGSWGLVFGLSNSSLSTYETSNAPNIPERPAELCCMWLGPLGMSDNDAAGRADLEPGP